MLSTVIYDLDCGIPAKYSKRQTSFYSMQVSFRFHSLRRSEILVSPSICTKIRTWRFHRTKEVLNFPSNPKSLHRLNSSIFKKKSLCGQIPSTSGVLRVARCGSGAKAPPLAARPVDTYITHISMSISANLGRDTDHNSTKVVCDHPKGWEAIQRL